MQSYNNIPRLSNESIDYIRVMQEISMELSESITSCKWFGSETEFCDDLFTNTYTQDGLCYTFNGLNGTDLYREDTVQYRESLESFVNISSTGRINRTLSWSLERGYPKNEPLKTYPARVVSASNKASFDVGLISYRNHLDYACSGPTQGFKVIIHAPDDVPSLSRAIVRVSLEKYVVIVVKPIMVTTSDDIAKYSPKKRNCFMDNERQLRFFKGYSDKNCEMECITNYTLKECGCVKFSMPRTPDMPVCAEDKIACYLDAEDKMIMDNFRSTDPNKDDCNCLPSCTSLEFDTEISQADFDAKKSLQAMNYRLGEDKLLSHMVVHFKDKQFIASKRSELYGLYDFIANVGGTLGLFMGFSLLCIVELIYHFTVRLWSTMKRKQNV